MDGQSDRHRLFGRKNWGIKPNFFHVISSEDQIKFQTLKSSLTTEPYFLVFPESLPHTIYRGGQKYVYGCEYAEHVCLLVTVLFSTRTMAAYVCESLYMCCERLPSKHLFSCVCKRYDQTPC